MSKVVFKTVITGTSRGIGVAISKRLILDGWQVYNLDIGPPLVNLVAAG